MWLRGFDFVVIEREGGRKNQRENRWAQEQAEGGREEKEPAGKPLDVGTSGERGA